MLVNSFIFVLLKEKRDLKYSKASGKYVIEFYVLRIERDLHKIFSNKILAQNLHVNCDCDDKAST